MFGRMKERVKSWMELAKTKTGMAKEFKDIFEVGGVPAFNQFYYFGIFIWKYLYRGYYKPWHRISAPTVKDALHERDLERMDTAKAICAELAGLIWNEQCEISVSQETGKDQLLDEFVHDVLMKNGFWTKMQEHIEQVLALGGGAIKVWYEEKRDGEGNVIPNSGNIRLGFCMADQFVPTAWDNTQVTDGVFISRQAKDGYYYTRLEWHKWDGLTYWISNEAYRSEYKQNSAKEPQDILGFRCGHHPIPVIPGVTIPRTRTKQNKEQNDKTYARSQQQRALERNIRYAKQRAAMLEAAGDAEGFAALSAKIKEEQRKYIAFCKATGRTKRPDRTQVFGYNRDIARNAKQVQRFNSAINGIKTVDGVAVSVSAHTYGQAKARNVSAKNIVDALTAALSVRNVKFDAKNRPSKQYIGAKATACVNPLNGRVTSCWKTSSEKAKKLARGKDDEV